jgi:hypothetical protein
MQTSKGSASLERPAKGKAPLLTQYAMTRLRTASWKGLGEEVALLKSDQRISLSMGNSSAALMSLELMIRIRRMKE